MPFPAVGDTVKSALTSAASAYGGSAAAGAGGTAALDNFNVLTYGAGTVLQAFDTATYITQIANSDNEDVWTVRSTPFVAKINSGQSILNGIGLVNLTANCGLTFNTVDVDPADVGFSYTNLALVQGLDGGFYTDMTETALNQPGLMLIDADGMTGAPLYSFNNSSAPSQTPLIGAPKACRGPLIDGGHDPMPIMSKSEQIWRLR